VTLCAARAAHAHLELPETMGIVFMSLFISNNLIGWIGGLYERMGPLQFWLMHALIGAAGGLLVTFFGHRISRELQPGATV
jgi:proton-dependent oligopeptide transporter, POT family